MNEIAQKNPDFMDVYNQASRLAAAVFMISNAMGQNGELESKIKNLSLNLASASVLLKDNKLNESKIAAAQIEKISLELMSMLNIASIAGLISQMNSGIIREEFNSFISELGKYMGNFGNALNVKVAFNNPNIISIPENRLNPVQSQPEPAKVEAKSSSALKNHGLKRKDLRKSTILEFIKRHNNISIKDIVPNISGCSEKTVQRELIELIKGGKIKKTGERRWSKYSII